MGRRRIELPPHVEADIAARTARGESAQTIHDAVGPWLSIASLERRQAALRQGTSGTRGPTAAPKPASAPGSTPVAPGALPDAIPDSTTLEDLNRWLAIVDEGMRTAERDGNLAALASLAAKAATLASLKLRATPVPPPDPNVNPDFLKLAADGEARLLKLVQGLL